VIQCLLQVPLAWIKLNFAITTLENVTFGEIHQCFAAAFADYAVQAAVMDQSALARRCRKNGWRPQLSAGAWERGALVAVSLTGLDDVGGERRAYDICTGVIPDHRGKGVAGRMMDAMRPWLDNSGAAALQLEVLQGNAAGVRAYEKAGFATTRALVSYAATAKEVVACDSSAVIRPVSLDELLRFSPLLEFEPSYEQRDAAIRELADDLVMLGAFLGGQCVAAVAYDTKTEWLMRLVTHPENRRQGCASALLGALAGQCSPGALLKAVNVDENASAMRALMPACGLSESVRQWEMRLELQV
jgi:GNAT superfamily N-acetyltransferase